MRQGCSMLPPRLERRLSAVMIARKKVNTLILLQSSALIEQWESAMETFLIIDEEPPGYETPAGRIKRRKSVIGRLQGAHDSTTGTIDIAMIGSLCKKGEFHHRLKEFGMVIVDECHHAASDTFVEVLQEVRAKEQGIAHKALLEADEEIIIASPVISGPKIEELIQFSADNLMRVCSKGLAAELLEIMFGKREVDVD